MKRTTSASTRRLPHHQGSGPREEELRLRWRREEREGGEASSFDLTIDNVWGYIEKIAWEIKAKKNFKKIKLKKNFFIFF